MKFSKLFSVLAIALVLTLTACGNSATSNEKDAATTAEVAETPAEEETAGEEALESENDTSSDEGVEYPLTITHALGEIVLESKPERIATIGWGNQDVPLALGVVPVGASEANYGVIDGSGMLPWTKEGYEVLGVDEPVLFRDTDGLDYEAIADAEPDVILAAYSGITQEEYNLLSEIAPVVAYPNLPWQTFWRDQIVLDAEGMGMKAEGEELVSELDQLIAEKTSEYPQIEGKKAAFFYFYPTDFGKFFIYLPSDPRADYLVDLGMEFPESVLALADDSDSFAIEISAENIEAITDVDIIIAYGDEALLEALQADPLLGTIPAIERGSVVMLEDGTPMAASSTPSALSIPASIDEYLNMLGEAADKVK